MSELPLKEAIKILTQEKKKVELKLAKAYDSFCLYPNERDQNDWDRFSALDSAFEMAISALQAQDVPDTNVGDMVSKRFVELLAEYHDPEICPYKEYKGKPYFSIKYIENGEEYVGYGTYSPKVMSQYLREYFIEPERKTGKWLPDNTNYYDERYICSRCGCNYKVGMCMGKPMWNFCPNCGSYNGGDSGVKQ